MKRGMTILIGAGVGAGLMYMYDPQMGRRRRAVARDKIIRAAHKIDDAKDVTSRDFVNRTGGLSTTSPATSQACKANLDDGWRARGST